jgi:dienelactone hydrolase
MRAEPAAPDVISFTSDSVSDGVRERFFALGGVPGVLWTPAGAVGQRPLVLLGHGGGQHKTAPGMIARARRFVTELHCAVAAIDAPEHGDRPRTEAGSAMAASLRERMRAGEPVGPHLDRYHTALAEQAVPDWRASLDALTSLDDVGTAGPAGYWGVSMGAGLGIPLVAAEPRITAAVFGLAGREGLAETAARITVPVQFLVQWDDEFIARESSLALFDAFGSADKTLHANRGRHADLPRAEMDCAVHFFARHLGTAPDTATAAPGAAG